MYPAFDKIREMAAAGDYKRIPICKELYADSYTPVEMMRILQKASHHCYLLESASQNEVWTSSRPGCRSTGRRSPPCFHHRRSLRRRSCTRNCAACFLRPAPTRRRPLSPSPFRRALRFVLLPRAR